MRFREKERGAQKVEEKKHEYTHTHTHEKQNKTHTHTHTHTSDTSASMPRVPSNRNCFTNNLKSSKFEA